MPQFEFHFNAAPIPDESEPAPELATETYDDPELYVYTPRPLTPDEEARAQRFRAWSDAQEQAAMYTRYGPIPEDIRQALEILFQEARRQ